MNYQDTLTYLYTKLPMYQRQGAAALKFSLDNIIALMASIDDPHKRVKTVHIAGTNGKGSSAHMLASVLQAAGYRTGLYTSPHLKSFTERIKINGQEIDQAAVTTFVERVKPYIETIQPSFFEITFAMAMDYFTSQEVDLAIIEVGMGGRLDSTNIITPELCLITNISFDHQQLLGDTLEKIAGEKAGIIKKNVPVVITQRQPEVAHVFTEKAAAVGAPIHFADQKYVVEEAVGGRLNIIARHEVVYEGLQLDLKGSYQKYNLPGVIMSLDLLKQRGWQISEAVLEKGLSGVVRSTGLKGRWQQLGSQPLIIADTGHNESGINEIINNLKNIPYRRLHVVWGMVSDKEAGKILDMLPVNADYYFVKPDIPRGLETARLQAMAGEFGLVGEAYNSVETGINAAKKRAGRDDLIFIGGSTFVVAEIPEL